MGKYTRLKVGERFYIQVGLKRGDGVRQIARELGRNAATVSREIKQGMCTQIVHGIVVEVYDYSFAQRQADINAQRKGAPVKIGRDHATAQALEERLRNGYSPYAAIEDARRSGELGTAVCPNTLYSYIRKGVLGVGEECLVHGFRAKKKKPFDKRRDALMKRGGQSIAERPLSVLKREEFGHWEGDLVVSARPGKAAILTLVERKTRYLIALPVANKEQASIQHALDEVENLFGESFNRVFVTSTWDNGIEFCNTTLLQLSVYPHLRDEHGQGGRLLKVYYAHPYCSSERGSNENANRMIRRRFPKSTVFEDVSAEELARHVAWVNSYPRKIFDGRCSSDLFKEELAKLDAA